MNKEEGLKEIEKEWGYEKEKKRSFMVDMEKKGLVEKMEERRK